MCPPPPPQASSMQAFKHPPHQRQWGQIVVQSHLAQRRQQERRVLFFQHFPSHHRAVPKRPADGEKYPPALVPKGPTQRGTPNQPGQVLKTPLTCNTPTTTTTIRHSGHFNSPPTHTHPLIYTKGSEKSKLASAKNPCWSGRGSPWFISTESGLIRPLRLPGNTSSPDPL